MKYLLLLLLTFPLFALQLQAPVRHGYFKIEIDGVMQPEKYTTYRKATFAHTQAVMANPEAVIKLIPDWYEDIKVTGNKPPVAIAGDDQTVNEGDTVYLPCDLSYDPDGSIVKCEWEQISGVPIEILFDAEGKAYFIAPQIPNNDPLV